MTIIEMTVTGALMILGVIVLRAVTVSKLPKRAFIIMWEIALLRLILPISVPVKILPAVQTVTVIDSPSSYDIVAEPVRNDFVLVIPEEVREFIPSSAPAPVSVPTPPAANTPSFTATPQMIWIAGAVVLAVFFAISYLRSIRRFRSAKQCDSDFIRGWLLEHPIWRPLSVKVSRAVSSPLTYGFLNPVILLPPEYENADERSLGFVLEHEFAHIRHFDALKKLVCTAALCVHWFNPLMWVLYLLYNRDMELWCDESVIKKFGATSRAQYARLLISIEESRSAGVPLLSHFGRSTTEERIVSIMKFKKTTIISATVAVLLIAAVTAAIIATSVNPVPKKAEGEPISDSHKYGSDMLITYEDYITDRIFSNQGQIHPKLRAGEDIDYSEKFKEPYLEINFEAGDRAVIIFDFGHPLTDDEEQVGVIATKNSTTRYDLTNYIISDSTKLIYLFVAPETANYFFEYTNPSKQELPVIGKWIGLEGDEPYIFGGYGEDIEISPNVFEGVADELENNILPNPIGDINSFPINVFIDSETSQKYYSVYDKYAVAIAPEDEEMFASSEYSMTPEELDQWVHREFDRILGLTEGKMFYDSAANLLVEYDAIGKDGDVDTLNYHVAESLGATVGIVAAPVFTVPVNLVFTERYVTPADEADYESAVEFPITVYVNTYTGDRYYSYYDRFAVYAGEENEYMFAQGSYTMTAAGFEAWIQSEFDRILNLTEGEMYYNTDTNELFKYDGITFGNTGVCDTLNYHMCESLAAYAGMITNSFEKPVKMVFTEWLTNPASAVSWNISYDQPATGDLSGIKNYFDYTKKRWGIKDEVPIIEDPELYAAATNIYVETDVMDSQINGRIYPSISAVAGDEHGLVAIIEVDTRDLVLPEGMPENAVLQFMGATNNFYAPGLWHPLDFVSQNGNVYSYAYSCFAIDRGLPNQVNIELRNFGYYDGEEFVPLIMGTYSLIIDSKKFNTTEKLKKISKPVEVRGVKLELELTPFGLVVKASNSQMEKLGLRYDKYFLSQGDCFDFYLRDGSVIGSEENYFDTAFYGLMCTAHGWIDFDNDIGYDHYGYQVPIDVDKIVAVTVHGVRFDLKYAE